MIIYLSDYYPGVPGLRRSGQAPSPCFVLHRMGFFVPRRLLAGRWALTPPFHPFQEIGSCLFQLLARPGKTQPPGGLFSVTLSVTAGFHRRFPRVLHGMLPCGVRTFLYSVQHEQRSSAIHKRV